MWSAAETTGAETGLGQAPNATCFRRGGAEIRGGAEHCFPGRDAHIGASLLSIHNPKCFVWSGGEIAARGSAPPRAPAVVVRITADAPRLRVKLPARRS